jgi:glycosyltransferase involved in cell wall biosynthesis
MPGGIIGSTIGYLEAKKWDKEKLQEYTDLFLPPSQFMKDTVVRGGYDPRKFRVLCNFIDVDKVKNPCFEKKDYYVYLGRVNEVKGVRTLCKAASTLPYKLIVIGGGELLLELQEQYKTSDIEFKGQMEWNDFRPIIEGAKFMVLPSEWSENNPLTVIESQSLGTPVLGARIGGIPELIEEGVTGMTFESGNVEDLKEKIELMWNASFNYKEIADNAVKRYSSEAYYKELMKVYKGDN